MLIIFLLLAISHTIKVENGEQYLKIIELTKEEHRTEMLPQQTKRIFKYNDSKTTIGLQINANDSQLQCSGFGRNILFDPYDRNYIKILNMSTHSYYSDDSLKLQRNVNSPDYFASNPILIGVVNTTFGLIMLSSDHNLHVVNISYSNQSNKFRNESSQSYNFSQLRQTQYEQTTAQLLWDDIKNIIYIIFPQQVVIGKVSKHEIKFHNSNISIVDEQAYIGIGKIYRGYLFLARGRLGIDIYSMSDSGELILMKNLYSQLEIPNMNVIDFDFGGFDHNYIFVLDQYQGMMIHSIEIAKFEIVKWLDDLIPIQNGKLIKVYQRTILILQEHNSYNQITEFCIYTQDKKLFYMKTHYLDGKYFDIDVEEQFAIVRGYDSHKVIYHSVHQNFEQYHSNPVTLENWLDEEVLTDDQEEYLTIPQLQQFILSKHDDKDIMIAVTSKNLVFLRYLKVDPYVECTLSRLALEGSEINLQATLNSTWCDEKAKYETYDHKEPLYLSLVMCQKQVSYIVDVGKSLETEKNFYFYYVTITVVSLVLLFGLLLILKHYFAKYNQRHEDLEKAVADLSKQTYQQDSQVSGF